MTNCPETLVLRFSRWAGSQSLWKCLRHDCSAFSPNWVRNLGKVRKPRFPLLISQGEHTSRVLKSVSYSFHLSQALQWGTECFTYGFRFTLNTSWLGIITQALWTHTHLHSNRSLSGLHGEVFGTLKCTLFKILNDFAVDLATKSYF